MSGAIRRSVGPAKARLCNYLAEVPEEKIVLDPTTDVDTQTQVLREHKAALVLVRSKILKTVELLQRKDAEWSQLIDKDLDGADRERETELYQAALDDPAGYMAVMFQGIEKTAELDTWVAELDAAISRLEERRVPLQRVDHTSSTPQSAVTDVSSRPQTSPTQPIGLQLPKLQLPKFQGDPCSWKPFWDVFDSSVHQQVQLSNAMKFNYLQSALSGVALSAIDGIPISNENYSQAISILKERFGDVEIIKETLYAQLRGLSRCKSQNLRFTVETVEKTMRQLEALGEVTAHPFMVQLILQILPAETLLELERAKRFSEPWTVASLIAAIWTIVKVQDKIRRLTALPEVAERGHNVYQDTSYMSGKEAKQISFQKKKYVPHSTTESFNTSVNYQQAAARQPCVFCSGRHFSDVCPQFNSFAARRKKLSELKRCYLCFQLSHTSKDCTVKQRKCAHCDKTGHNRALCFGLFKKKDSKTNSAYSGVDSQEVPPDSETESDCDDDAAECTVEPSDVAVGASNASSRHAHSAILLTAHAQIRNPNDPSKCFMANILLDGGSQRSFSSKVVADSLNLEKKENDPLSLYTFASEKPQQMFSYLTDIDVVLQNGSTRRMQTNVLPYLTGTIQKRPLSKGDLAFLEKLPKNSLADSIPANTVWTKPDILIGNDQFWNFIKPEKQKTLPSGLKLIASTLGFLLGGSPDSDGISAKEPKESAYSLVVGTQSCDILPEHQYFVETDVHTEKMCDWWALESIGITDSPITTDDDIALNKFNDTILFDCDKKRYSVRWPFKSELPELPSNYQLALGRFKSLSKRLADEPDLLEKYDAVIKDQVEKGIIERVADDMPTDSRIHYLAHHAVITPLKNTTKLRVVYDASAKARVSDCSLNDCMFRGPVMLPDLVGLLLRFREKPVVLLADVEKAFLQIELQPSERDCTRFLWYRNPKDPVVKDNLQTYRFARVPFGVVSSPFLLCATIKHHLQNEGGYVAQKIIDNIYVDNVVIGVETITEALDFYMEAKKLFSKASFNLREWVSNRQEVIEVLREEDRAKITSTVKVLGMTWKPVEDTIEIRGPKEHKDMQLTKRSTLSAISSVFDPLGLCAPVTLVGKLFVQELWRTNKTWDEPFSEQEAEKWKHISQTLCQMPLVVIPREFKCNKATKIELHVFVDASPLAYATTLYLRICDNEHTKIVLIFAKTRLAPHEMSIPRMELLAMLIGVRAAHFVKEQLTLEIAKIYLWSDSKCCLYWLKSSKSLSAFVTNRMKEIRAASSSITFCYVSSEDNPADVATHGCSVQELLDHQLWWTGPPWLGSDEWPTSDIPEITEDILKEVQGEYKGSKIIHSAAVAAIDERDEEPPIVGAIDEHRFSSVTKLCRVTVYMFRFLMLLMWSKLTLPTQTKFESLGRIFDQIQMKGPLAAKEITAAKHWWIRNVQKTYYEDVIKSPKHKLRKQLNIEMDEHGLLRCHGRLFNANIPDDSKQPLLLPNKGKFSELIIEHTHRQMCHAGVKHTLSAIRQEIWIPKARNAIQKIISKCIVCKKYGCGPYKLPPMAQLPALRVTRMRPFQTTGVDYLGPVLVRKENQTVKVWIALFTCAVTRAIHLEMVNDMSSKEFLNGLRRFIARRGRPDYIISDNAKQFQLTAKLLQGVWREHPDEEVLDYCANRDIKWHFIPEYSPWYGGFYERLVKDVKSALKKTTGKKLLDFDELNTILPEIEAVLMSRPLTNPYADFASFEVLRAVDLVVPKGHTGTLTLRDPGEEESDPEYVQIPSERDRLLQYWRDSTGVLDYFWERWHKDYLLNLRETHQMLHKSPRVHAHTEPQIDEVVIVKQPNAPRGKWSIGKIAQLNQSSDGQVRTVRVLMPNRKIVTRPVSLIYPLEVPDRDKTKDRTVQAEVRQALPTTTNDMSAGSSSCNRRITRSQTRSANITTVTTTMALLFALCTTGTSANSCSKIDAKLTKVDSQSCVQKGIVVFRKTDNTMCWKHIDCPMGHLDGKGSCGEKCACPEWATECSYYTGKEPSGEGHRMTILKQQEPSICSFVSDARCNPVPTHQNLNQIELFDGTTYFVTSLEIEINEATSEQFDCVGEGKETGTETFCEKHNCDKDGTRFCYYKSNDIAYFTSKDGKIPIKAWGTVLTKYYGPKTIEPSTSECNTCSLKCVTGGLEMTLEQDISLVEACANPYCFKVSNPKKTETLMFPTEINMHNHEFRVTAWSNGFIVKDFGVECAAKPFCEMIKCTLCIVRLVNPQCTPKLFLFTVFLLIYLSSLSLYFSVKVSKTVLYGFYYSAYACYQSTKFLIRLCRKLKTTAHKKLYTPMYLFTQEDGDTLPVTNPQNNAKRETFKPKLVYGSTGIMLLVFMAQSQACSEVTTLTAKRSSCTVTKPDQMECILSETSRLALSPQGQDSCLLVRDPNDEPIGTLSLEIKKIAVECQKKSLYHTRSFRMKIESSKRCSAAGSCTGNKCGDVTLKTKLDELKGVANDSPGYTFCMETCGGPACGCVLLTPACLFYRTYVLPHTDTIYEVFTCPLWEYKITGTARLMMQGTTMQHQFDMRPGVETSWNNIKLTLIAVTNPPTPLLQADFVTDGKRTARVEASPAGQPQPASLGAMQCGDRAKAQELNCFIPANLCNCNSQGTGKVSCVCAKHELEPLFADTEKALPLQLHGISLMAVEDKVQAEYSEVASLEVQVTLEGFKLSSKTDKNTCTVTPLEFGGCYNCITGAQLQFICKTDFGEGLAHVTCGTGTFSTICTPKGLKAKTSMAFSKANIKEVCQVRCPAGTTTFEIESILAFIEPEQFNGNNSIAMSKDKKGKKDVDFSFLTQWLTGNWMASLISVIIVVILVFLTIPLLPIFFNCLFTGVSRASLWAVRRHRSKVA